MKEVISENRSFLMGLAMLAIVLFHHGWVIIPGVTAIFSRFGLWGVDIFLFLSGFGCVYALDKYSINIFWRKRVIRLLPTCLLAGILIYCFDLFFHAERVNAPIIIRLLSLHRWYIQVILICYLLCPFFYLILKKYRGYAIFAIIPIALLLESITSYDSIWKIQWAWGRIPVFMIGMYIAMFDLKMSKLQYVLSFIFLIAAIVTRVHAKFLFFNWALFLAGAMPFICETLCRLRNISKKIHIYHFFELLGLFSLEIYLIHEYFYWALYEVSLPLWCKYLLFLCIVTLLCWLLKLTANFVSKRSLWLGLI